MHLPVSVIGTALFAAAPISAFKFYSWTGKSCRGGPGGLGTVAGPDQGCNTLGAGVAGSVMIENTGDVDLPFYTVFFSSGDCNPNNEIKHADENDKCVDVSFSSWAVWNVCEGGPSNCLG